MEIDKVMLINKTSTGANNSTLFITGVFFLFLALVCFIINYSIDRLISWSLYPAGALVVIWATIAPLMLMKRNKTLGQYAGFTITLIAYLLLIQYLVPDKGWFIPLALPVAILLLLALGISIIAFTRFSINKYYAAAITVFLFGVIVNFGVGVIVDNFLNRSYVNDISRVSTIAGSVIVVLLLVAIGYIKKK